MTKTCNPYPGSLQNCDTDVRNVHFVYTDHNWGNFFFLQQRLHLTDKLVLDHFSLLPQQSVSVIYCPQQSVSLIYCPQSFHPLSIPPKHWNPLLLPRGCTMSFRNKSKERIEERKSNNITLWELKDPVACVLVLGSRAASACLSPLWHVRIKAEEWWYNLRHLCCVCKTKPTRTSLLSNCAALPSYLFVFVYLLLLFLVAIINKTLSPCAWSQL